MVNSNDLLTNKQIFDLVKSAQQGSEKALSEIIVLSTPVVHSQAKSFLSNGFELDDLCQEGMIGVLGAIKTFSENSGASFRTYLNICIKNRLLTVNRKRSEKSMFTDQTVSLSSEDTQVTSLQSVEEQLIGDDECKRIFDYIDMKLSEKERETLKLFLSGLSYEEIAYNTGATVKSVDSTLQRARKKLKLFKK